jgi:hypothetical protein
MRTQTRWDWEAARAAFPKVAEYGATLGCGRNPVGIALNADAPAACFKKHF